MSFSRLSILVAALALAVSLSAQPDRVNGRAFATRSEVIAQHGMAATSHPLASQIALDVLKAGGTAVDAAIAANAAIGLMEPTGNGIGGDLFAIVYDAKTKKLYGLNASGRSPLGLSREQLMAELKKINRPESLPMRGFLPISTPGAVDGWFELHGKFGKLPMKDILGPAIRYAREGFPVTEYIAYGWSAGVRNAQADKFPGAFLQVYAPNGAAPKKGEIFKNPALADTLTLIADGGRDAYYKGPIADKIDAFMRANGGYLRKADLEKHTSTWVEPASVNYRGYDVYELPPNSQGIAALQMLNILEGYDLKSMGYNSPEALHVMIEAKKLAFEDRAKFYADPEFSKIPLQGLLSKTYAAERRKLIDLKRAGRSYDAGNPAMQQGDTIYLTVADQDGNMVSLIQSNYRGMGSGISVPGLGFTFQNRGEMFTLQPGHANDYAPGKRPFQTIIPAFVMKDGKPWLSFGLMGGAMQPQGHVQIICNLIDWGMNFQEAGDAARWQHEGSSDYDNPKMTDGGYVEVETGVPYESIRALMQRGHKITIGNGSFGGYQAIARDEKNNTYIGASESRKDGHAAGY
ncbi:gamma-glutamyltransferase [Oleiharenicola lentus]|uniref:gamma-glutamyltransferase n=1 Tax=Oleiharenicola lentus TaxID=2508720 RepID=UPI003F66190A